MLYAFVFQKSRGRRRKGKSSANDTKISGERELFVMISPSAFAPASGLLTLSVNFNVQAVFAFEKPTRKIVLFNCDIVG